MPAIIVRPFDRRSRWGALAAVLVSAACQSSPPLPTDTTNVAMLALVAGSLDNPLYVTAPPADSARLFIVLQGGVIRVVRHDTLLTTPFLDLTAAVSCCGEQGLLGLAFHPHYASNGRFFVSYTDTAGNTRVVRYAVSPDPDVANPASADTILKQAQPYSNHNGGMLAFGPDGYLYFGLGDGGSGGDPQGNGQNTNTLLGKMLRLNVDSTAPYVVPATNPFVGRAGYLPEIWALGLRNPWRFSFDRQTGDLYIGDVGQNKREEIDVQGAAHGGQNYGWNRMEGTICYQSGCSTVGLTMPAVDYVNPDLGCAVTGGYVYRGSAIPALTGIYFYSDYCSGWIHSFRWAGGAATDHLAWPSLAPGGSVSSFGQDARGELYVVEHGGSGAVYRIVPDTTHVTP